MRADTGDLAVVVDVVRGIREPAGAGHETVEILQNSIGKKKSVRPEDASFEPVGVDKDLSFVVDGSRIAVGKASRKPAVKILHDACGARVKKSVRLVARGRG